jgi:hypothetical protein
MQPRTCQPVVRAFEPTAKLYDHMSFHPPRVPRQPGSLSGRPGCRIYARDKVWVLELDVPIGGWLDDRNDRSNRLTFPTLAAAIGYAEHHGLDYRIELPQARTSANKGASRSRRPRSLTVWPRGHGRRSRHRPS